LKEKEKNERHSLKGTAQEEKDNRKKKELDVRKKTEDKK